MRSCNFTRQFLRRRLYFLAILVGIVFAGVTLPRFGSALRSHVISSSVTCPSFRVIAPIPEARQRSAAACISVGEQDFIYVIGGVEPAGTVTGTIFYGRVFSFGEIESWRTKDQIFQDVVLCDAALVSAHGRLYCLGGDGGGPSVDTVYYAQPQSGTGETEWFTTTPLTVPIYLHAAVLLDDRIYVVGGYQSDPASSIFQAIPDVFSAQILGSGELSGWRQESSLVDLVPGGISAHAAVASQDHQCIYVVGGWLGSYSSGSPHKEVFRACIQGDGTLGKWEPEPEMLPLKPADAVGIYYHTAAIVDGRVFVIGGTVSTTHSRGSSDLVYVASIDASGHLSSWIPCDECLPRRLELHGATVSSSGRLYVIGGRDRSASSVYDAVQFTPLLGFEKLTALGGPVTYGDSVGYTLKLTNLGVRDLGGLVITDTVQANVPAVFEFRNLPGECQVCPYVADTITCAIPSLGLGATERLDFQVVISQPSTTTLLNDLNSFPIPYSKRDAEIDIVGVDPLRTRRNSPVVVLDDSSPSPHMVGILPESPDEGTVIPLEHNLPHHFSNSRLLHTAEVAALSDSREMEPSCMSSGLAPDCGADLRIEKSDDLPSVIAGQVLSYTLLVNNAGPAAAQDVVVVDYIPAGATFVTATSPLSSTTPLSWSLGSIPAETSQEIHMVVQVASGVSGTITNMAVVSSSTWDPQSDNNVDEEETIVVGRADLRIDKSADSSSVAPGGPLTYTLTVTNQGPSDAENVIVIDTLPAGVCDLDFVPPNCSSDPLMCDLGTLPAGDSGQIQINVAVCLTTTGVLTNTAVVTSATRDGNPANNEVKELTVVSERADLCIQKAGDLEKVLPGDELIYTLRVSNYGPSDAKNVVVSDTLPIGVDFRSSMPPLVGGPDPLTWYTGTLAATEVWTIEVTAAVGARASGVLVNAASVTSLVEDSDLSNNRDEAQTFAPVVVTNKAYVCEGRLWCKESNAVINSPFSVYLPMILRAASR